MSHDTQPGDPEHSPAIAAAIDEFAAEIARLGVTVITHPKGIMPDGRWGSYDHDTRTVHLLESLAPIQARSVLAHELAHAMHGHSGQQDCQEREAEATAARALIGSVDRLKAAAQGLNLIGTLAIGLGVLPRDISRYIEANPWEAAKAIMEAMTSPRAFERPKPSDYRKEHHPMPADLL